MLGSSFRLGKLFGVEVGINISLLIVAGLLTLSMADAYLPGRLPDRSDNFYILLGALTSVAFFGSVLWHEMAHALTAQYFGLPVRRIVLNFIGGIAEIEKEARKAYQEFWIAFVGPLSSAILGGGCVLLGFIVGNDTPLGVSLLWLGQVNLLLAAFNMLPGFPLDGGRVLRAVVWWATGHEFLATRIAVGAGQFMAVGLFFGSFASLLVGDLLGSFWLGFIGWFLWSSATGYLGYAKRRHDLRHINIGSALRGHDVYVQADWTILYALDIMSINGHRHNAIVMQNGQMIGVFSMEQLVRVPRFSWGTLTVRQLMQPLHGSPSVSPETNIFDAIHEMEQANADYVMVRQDQKTVGVLGRLELIRFAERQRRLEPLDAF